MGSRRSVITIEGCDWSKIKKMAANLNVQIWSNLYVYISIYIYTCPINKFNTL
jgi:hypothetical protein